MARQAAVGLLLAIVVSSACGRDSPNSPMPTPTAPPAPLLTAAQIEGRVVDVDLEEPMPGAQVTAVSVCYSSTLAPSERVSRCDAVDQPYSTTADEQGMFRLTANLPQDWYGLRLEVIKPGFEPATTPVPAESARNAVLRAYRSIRIRPGESVQLRVLFQETCAYEDIACRRINVEASPGEAIELEVLPLQAEDAFGVMVEPFPAHVDPLQTRLTVRSGDAWIVRSSASVGSGIVTVAARR